MVLSKQAKRREPVSYFDDPRGGGSARSPDLITENYDGKIMIGSDNVQIFLGTDDSNFVCAGQKRMLGKIQNDPRFSNY